MASQPPALLRKKWERVFFTFFDMNKSRTIDWNDFELLFEKIKELRGEDSTEFRICHAAMLAVWKGLLQATKGSAMTTEVPADASVSLAEWSAIWKAYDGAKLQMWQAEYLKYMFFLLDSSGDKVIDKAEYSNVMGLYGLTPAECSSSFDAFALDDSGRKTDKVDYGMFVRLFNEYFTSADPRAPGNHLFGPLD